LYRHWDEKGEGQVAGKIKTKRYEATLIPGDGIGPEIVEAAHIVLHALGSPFDWDVQQGGASAVETAGDPLPAATLQSIHRTKLALKGR
jgi:isocitrate dehydrogenase (NAD+)